MSAHKHEAGVRKYSACCLAGHCRGQFVHCCTMCYIEDHLGIAARCKLRHLGTFLFLCPSNFPALSVLSLFPWNNKVSSLCFEKHVLN